ncbi:MAG TPA: NAD(P)/FAD-dependent oxidoreductase, partial [Longimicrobiales bacterium]|nr:NAD(P)/FAD-dependent oxidoreductase [Longimicrobiales bacterium]
IQPHDDPERFRRMGVEVVEGVEARLLPDGRVEAGGRTYAGRRTLIATGSRPAVPPVEGLEEAGHVTHEDAFDREGLPASAVVLGAGAVGVEFAQAYARLGVEVTLVEMEERVLPREDPELTDLLREVLEEEGVRVLTGVRAVRAGREGEERTLRVEPTGGADGELLRAEELLVATGRAPNVESLGLEEAGVRYGRSGIEVDGALRTSRRGVYAAGDVTGGHLFTHVADHEARTAVRNALFPLHAEVDYSVVPWAIFSEPELARVGLSEEEARERHGDAAAVYRYDLADLDRAVTDREARGMVKLIAGPKGELVGAHLLAPRAGSLVSEAALAVREGTKVTALADLVHPYPTLSEGIRRAAQEAHRARLTPRAERWLDRWFRLARRLGL